MSSINDREFEQLLADFEDSSLHLETRDAYGTAIELPYMAKWAAGEADDLQWLQGWCATVRDHVAAGRSVRRARIVSEPLCDYQRWSHSIADPMVNAGEDIRWIPRRRVSSICIPGNDFYLFDHQLVVFLHYSGDGLGVAKVTSTDPQDIQRCHAAFTAVWEQAIPHREYQPV